MTNTADNSKNIEKGVKQVWSPEGKYDKSTNTIIFNTIERLENEFLKVADKVSKMNAKENAQQKTTTKEGSGVKYSLPLSEIRKWNIAWDEDNHSSIKSQLIKHLDEVNAMSPVAEVDFVKEANKTYSKILEEVLKKNFGNKIQTQSYGEIIFDDDAIGALGTHVNNDSEAAAAMAAPYVIKKRKSHFRS